MKNTQIRRLLRHTSKFARNIFSTNNMYLKASTGIKISTFLAKNGGMRLWITKWTFNSQLSHSSFNYHDYSGFFFDRFPLFDLLLLLLLVIVVDNNIWLSCYLYFFQNISFHQPSTLTTDYYTYYWQNYPEDLPPPGPWQFAGLWLGETIPYNSTPIADTPDVKVYTGNEVPYHVQNITSSKYSQYTLLDSNPRKTLRVGDVVHFLIEARDTNGQHQSLGGDFWSGVIQDASQKAYTYGRVTDFNNGTYLMTFVLPWTGQADVEIKLLYPSRIVNWLRTRYREANHYPSWHGTFKRGKQTKTSHCHVSYGKIPQNVCEYRHYRALKHTRFFCRKPAGFSCAHLVGHRNVLSYGKAIAKIMKADHTDIFKGWVLCSKMNLKMTILTLFQFQVVVANHGYSKQKGPEECFNTYLCLKPLLPRAIKPTKSHQSTLCWAFHSSCVWSSTFSFALFHEEIWKWKHFI